MVNKQLLLMLFFCTASVLSAADYYSDGLNAYREGRNEEAAAFLEKALEEDPSNDGACLYLGILYQKASRPDQAEQIMLTGGALNGKHHYELMFNLGNLYFSNSRYDLAKEQFTYVAGSLSPFRTRALLNRANMAVNTGEYQNALDDYLDYLLEEPETPRRENIEKMVTLLRQQLDEEERQRVLEEDRIRREQDAARQKELEEQQRLEEEARQRELAEQARREEEERQKALLNEILNSLSTAGEETQNITADSEKVEETFEESDLDD